MFGTIPLLAIAMASAQTLSVTTVLYDDQLVKIEGALPDARDLWVPVADLKRINGFELKPQGACRGDLCIPIKQQGEGAVVIRRDGKKWFNLTAFARKVGQAFIHDAETNVWSLGEIPVLRETFLKIGIAPDFALPDRTGKVVRLSDFRGKKVLLLTWASW